MAPTIHMVGNALGGGGGAIWTPFSLGSKLFAFLDPALGITVPSITWNDADMEAVGVGDWTAGGATLTKPTADPYEGARNLRITNTGAWSGSARQAAAVVGQRAQLIGVSRDDGIGTPFVQFGTTLASLGQNTPWTPFDEENDFATNGNLYLGFVYSVGSGEWAEFDGTVVTMKSVSAWADQSGGGHGVAQSTASAQPYRGTRNGASAIVHDGSADLLVSGEAASTYNFAHSGAGGHVIVSYWLDTSSQINGIWDTGRLSTNTLTGLQIYHRTDTSAAWTTCGNGNGVGWTFQKSSSGDGGNAGYVVSVGYKEGATDEVLFRLNEADVYRGARDGEAPSSGDASYALTLGSRAGGGFPLAGAIGRYIVCNDQLTAEELAAAEAWCKKGLAL